MKTSNLVLISLIVLLLVGLGIFLMRASMISLMFAPRPSQVETGIRQQDLEVNSVSDEAVTDSQDSGQVEIFADNLNIPWEIVFLPDDSLLVTQRPGQLLRIDADSQEQIEIEGVEHVGEGGLLGLALHPEFEQNGWLYLYLTTRTEDGLINRVERYVYDMDNNQLSDKQEIISNIPGAQNHDGGRMAFGPDGLLYITTGDASQAGLAQDLDSLAGKILRLNTDGTVPAENPYNSPVYSYGHRNPQGLTWDADGRLWASEHGPSGRDEINLIEPGNNYGWPEITGDETQQEMISPVIHSGTDDTWAPSGIEIINNTLLFAGLRGSALYSAQISGEDLLNLERNFPDEYGRMRAVHYDGQDWIYAATNNRDGRGRVRPNDDKIIRFRSSLLDL